MVQQHQLVGEFGQYGIGQIPTKIGRPSGPITAVPAWEPQGQFGCGISVSATHEGLTTHPFITINRLAGTPKFACPSDSFTRAACVDSISAEATHHKSVPFCSASSQQHCGTYHQSYYHWKQFLFCCSSLCRASRSGLHTLQAGGAYLTGEPSLRLPMVTAPPPPEKPPPFRAEQPPYHHD